MSEEEKFHIYLFCFMEPCSGGFKTSHTSRKHDTQCVTADDLAAAKKRAGVSKYATIISVNYMGYMTESAYVGECKHE